MEANRLAEFRVRRREICLIVNSDDRRVGIYSLRGVCVAAALRAARHKAQRILFKKGGLQNCNPPFLIFFYFLRQTEGIKRTSSGMISRRPSSMMALIVSLLMPERKPKLHVGPTAPRPGPTLLMAVSEAVTNAIVHAYPQEIGKIALRACIFDGNLLEITVRDWGCGIADVEKAREPLYTTGGEERSGMGFTIMESFMDSLAVRSKNGKGTVVTMKRRIALRTARR
jgi:anti-sigma F factor